MSLEQHYRVSEVAKKLGVSSQTVRRIFEDIPGVKVYGNRLGTKHKRPHKTLLIPESVIEHVLTGELSV